MTIWFLMQSLLDDGSDPFFEDYQGQNAFIVLAKHGHLWCLHFYHSYIWYEYNIYFSFLVLLI